MDLDNPIWNTLKGGYRDHYNAAVPLRKLSKSNTADEQESLFKELWENLHHQGDVELASYLAVPQLITICIAKKSVDWNYIGLVVVIENCRHQDHNLVLPGEYADLYFNSLRKFEQYLISNLKTIPDKNAFTLTLALIALVNGHPELGKALELLDDDEIAELLDKY